eukprot:jgi/Tetstr1/439533/TSEL_027962.t1
MQLEGWGETVHENLGDYDDVLKELHGKYKGRAKMAPELKLPMMLVGSAFMYHMTNVMFKSAPALGQVVKDNPDLMKQFAAATANTMQKGGDQPGMAGLFSGMFGGGPAAPPPAAPAAAPPAPLRGPSSAHVAEVQRFMQKAPGPASASVVDAQRPMKGLPPMPTEPAQGRDAAGAAERAGAPRAASGAGRGVARARGGEAAADARPAGRRRPAGGHVRRLRLQRRLRRLASLQSEAADMTSSRSSSPRRSCVGSRLAAAGARDAAAGAAGCARCSRALCGAGGIPCAGSVGIGGSPFMARCASTTLADAGPGAFCMNRCTSATRADDGPRSGAGGAAAGAAGGGAAGPPPNIPENSPAIPGWSPPFCIVLAVAAAKCFIRSGLSFTTCPSAGADLNITLVMWYMNALPTSIIGSLSSGAILARPLYLPCSSFSTSS